MSKPQIAEYMNSVFEPLTSLSQLPALLGKLKTSVLPDEIKESQFKRFKSIEIAYSDVLLLSSRTFFVKIRCEDELYIAFNVSDLSSDELMMVESYCLSEGIKAHYLEPCFFLELRHVLQSNYKLHSDYRGKDSARDFIDVVDHNYNGHDIFDVMKAYEKVAVFHIPKESLYTSYSPWVFVNKISIAIKSMRSPLIDEILAKKIERLTDISLIPADNIYVFLTAIHWKYVFFELYKCVEKIFYLPWHIKLKSSLSCSLTASALADLCRTHIDWRAKEEASIRGVFELVADECFSEKIVNCTCFSDIKNDTLSKASYGRKIYKIRNILVHQQDYDDPGDIEMSDQNWTEVCEFLSDVVYDLYHRHLSEIQ